MYRFYRASLHLARDEMLEFDLRLVKCNCTISTTLVAGAATS